MPVIESLADEFAGRAHFVKVDLSRDGEVLDRFDASGVPAYLLFRDGEEVGRLRLGGLGWFLEGRLRRMLEKSLRP